MNSTVLNPLISLHWQLPYFTDCPQITAPCINMNHRKHLYPIVTGVMSNRVTPMAHKEDLLTLKVIQH